jgi:hypothetical protein
MRLLLAAGLVIITATASCSMPASATEATVYGIGRRMCANVGTLERIDLTNYVGGYLTAMDQIYAAASNRDTDVLGNVSLHEAVERILGWCRSHPAEGLDRAIAATVQAVRQEQ